jgi:hypothetical protein
VQAPLWIRSGNIHISTNNAKYGDFVDQDATVTTNDVPFFEDFNLADLYFKNAGAGSNTVVYFVGIRMTEGRMRELGVI